MDSPASNSEEIDRRHETKVLSGGTTGSTEQGAWGGNTWDAFWLCRWQLGRFRGRSARRGTQAESGESWGEETAEVQGANGSENQQGGRPERRALRRALETSGGAPDSSPGHWSTRGTEAREWATARSRTKCHHHWRSLRSGPHCHQLDQGTYDTGTTGPGTWESTDH